MKIQKKINPVKASTQERKESKTPVFGEESKTQSILEDIVTDLKSIIDKLSKIKEDKEVIGDSIANIAVIIFDIQSLVDSKNEDISKDTDKEVSKEVDDEVEDTFWSTDVSSEDDVKAEIEKALASGTTYYDIVDYLDELLDSRLISEEQYNSLNDMYSDISE